MTSQTLNDTEPLFRSGIVAVMGRPNVGKSSLINRLLDYKVTIVSPKPQTTRDNIICIFNRPNLQIIFKDTPGVHVPKHKLGEHLVNTARKGMEDSDLILYLVEATDRNILSEDMEILQMINSVETPFLLAVNKIDKIPGWSGVDLERIADLYTIKRRPSDKIPLSVMKRQNLDQLVDMISSFLPAGFPLYPEDIIIDRSERFLASEIIREKIFLLTHMEIPHSTAVIVEEYKSPDEYPERKDLYIRATIFVERESQKGIIIGSSGDKLKQIGSYARKDLEKLSGNRVFLDLWVKVRKSWRRSEKEVKRMMGNN
ncbi:MAG TPA: GTPase Era [Synergistales bacterium]|nr:GTPase Era [Synergistales bacterium]